MSFTFSTASGDPTGTDVKTESAWATVGDNELRFPGSSIEGIDTGIWLQLAVVGGKISVFNTDTGATTYWTIVDSPSFTAYGVSIGVRRISGAAPSNGDLLYFAYWGANGYYIGLPWERAANGEDVSLVAASGLFSVDSNTVSSITAIQFNIESLGGDTSDFLSLAAEGDTLFLGSGDSNYAAFKITAIDGGDWTFSVTDGVGSLGSVSDVHFMSFSKRGPVGPMGMGTNYLLYEERQTAGTAGGTFTSGAWRTRALNTEVVDTDSLGSVASSQITLPSGTYYCRFWAEAYKVANHKTLLYNVTGATNLLIGSSCHNNATDASVQTVSTGCGHFTLGATSAIELRHRCGTTQTSNGLGVPSNFAVHEVYAGLELWKVS